jgi:hypothetical protein
LVLVVQKYMYMSPTAMYKAMATPSPYRQVGTVEKLAMNTPMVTDDEGEQFPAVSEEAVKMRRKRLVLDHPQVQRGFSSCEFVSLGACCAVSRGLQYLGLKKHSYPFDWLRSPVEGVIHLLETDFVDFLTYTEKEQKKDNSTIYKGTRWGGSFWHHDPADPRTLQDFTRRVRRLFGLEDVAATQPHCFVRAVNTTLELNACLRLREALQRSMPSTPFYLIILVDTQSQQGLFKIAGADNAQLLFYLIHDSKYGDGTTAAAERMLQIYAENYADAVAHCLHYWAGTGGAASAPREVANLAELTDLCEQFDGGDCNNGLFGPQRFKGQRMKARENTPQLLPYLMGVRSAQFQCPPYPPGTVINAPCFGGQQKITIPAGAKPGDMVKLELREGRLEVSLDKK